MLLNGHLEQSFARYTLFVDSYPRSDFSYKLKMLSHGTHIEVELLVIEHILDEEGVFSSLALHLCVERVILDKRSYLIGYHIFKREDGRDCGGVSTPGHGQGEGPARYEFRDSGTK